MRTRKLGAALLVLALCGFTTLSGCLVPDSGSESGTEVDMQPPTTAPDPETLVCNPLDGGESNLPREQGIRGTLFYQGSTQPRFYAVDDYLNQGMFFSDLVLYFNQIYVPTRPFDRGFVTQSNELITTPEGNALYEFFAVRHEGRIQLGSKTAQYYQFAVLSDDGAKFYMQQSAGDGFNILINNDGDHPTRMGCATSPVPISVADKIPFLLDYYQGPRYHISLVLMWRPWPMSAADPTQLASLAEANDAFCGVQGNSFYFDSTQNQPAPTVNYNALLARGWEPVAPENYLLPESGEVNPCNEPAPVISNFRATSITTNSVTLAWETSNASTTKALFKLPAAPVWSQLDGPQGYVTQHSVVVTGLNSNTDYFFKGSSAAISNLFTESPQITVRTRR